jgi:hypothetical protein
MSVGTLGEIRKALAKTVLGINGMRVAEHMPEQVNPPMVVIQLDRLGLITGRCRAVCARSSFC